MKKGMQLKPKTYTRYLRAKLEAAGMAHLPLYNEWYPSNISTEDVHGIVGRSWVGHPKKV